MYRRVAVEGGSTMEKKAICFSRSVFLHPTKLVSFFQSPKVKEDSSLHIAVFGNVGQTKENMDLDYYKCFGE